MAVGAIAACSGTSERHKKSSGTGETTGGAGSGATTGGSGAAAGSAGTTGGAGSGGASGAGGSAGTYVPDEADVPPEGDGRVNGSFEGGLGDGWDLCATKTPGAQVVRDAAEPSASAGSSYMSFDSTIECTNPCRPEARDAQFGFTLNAVAPAGDPIHLYFDAINLTDEAPSAVMQIEVLGFPCVSTQPIATIELGALGLTRTWQTRCVTFTPIMPFDVFGLYVVGEAFHIGLDTFRFGPPCHALPE